MVADVEWPSGRREGRQRNDRSARGLTDVGDGGKLEMWGEGRESCGVGPEEARKLNHRREHDVGCRGRARGDCRGRAQKFDFFPPIYYNWNNNRQKTVTA